jgi:hypothetical protein
MVQAWPNSSVSTWWKYGTDARSAGVWASSSSSDLGPWSERSWRSSSSSIDTSRPTPDSWSRSMLEPEPWTNSQWSPMLATMASSATVPASVRTAP